jgi:NAD(P)-dependent dehydrogenase (short-subunit alcohol dehydrogenase family)
MGQTIARLFAKEGATVLVSGRNEENLAALADEIGGHYALCDITKRDEVMALATTAREKMGRVDSAINATGWGLLKNLLEVTEEELDQIVDLQFKGVHHFLQAFVQAMIDNDPQGGSIIQISSATTRCLINDHSAYIGTKTGSEALIRCVANDFGHHNIRANTISPGFTKSPMTEQGFGTPGLVDAFLPNYPLGRLNDCDDIANAAVWLASDDAFLTGQNIQANGGLTLRHNPLAHEIGASVAAAMEKQGAS